MSEEPAEAEVVRVGGREYELTSDMSFSEWTEMQQTLQNEVEKFVDFARMMGLEVDYE